MATNLGLGFLFSASARGMAGALRVTQQGVAAIGAGLANIAKWASSNPIGSMIDALNLGVLRDIRSQMAGFVGMDTETARLTATIESFGVTADEAFSKVAAGLDLSGDEMARWRRTVTSAALATNTDVGGAVDAFSALHQSHLDLKKIGIPTFAQYLGLIKTAGLDGKKFTQTLGQLTNEFGLSDDQIKTLLDDYAHLSRLGNLGSEALGGMSEQLDTLRPFLVNTLKKRGPEAMMTMLRSTQALAGVMQNAFGGDPQANMAAALQLTQKLAESQFSLQGAFVGMGEIPEFQKALAQNFGSMQEAQELLSTDSVSFIRRLRDMRTELESKSPLMAASFMERMTRQLGEVDPQLANLFTQGTKVNEAFAKMGDTSGPIAGAEGALNRLEKAGMRTGRTLSDDVQLALDGFEHKLRAVGKQRIDELYRKKVIPAIGEFGDKLGELAKDDGVVGLVIRKLSDFQTIGMAAFLPMEKEWAQNLFVLAKQFAPLISALEPFMSALLPVAMLLPSLIASFATLGATLFANSGAILGALSGIAAAFAGVAFWEVALIAVAAAVHALMVGLAALAVAAGPAILLLGTDMGGKFAEMAGGWIEKMVPRIEDWVLRFSVWLDGVAAWIETAGDRGNIAQSIAQWFRDTFATGLGRGGELLSKFAPLKGVFIELGWSLVNLAGIAFDRAGLEVRAQFARMWESAVNIDWMQVGRAITTGIGSVLGSGASLVGSGLGSIDFVGMILGGIGKTEDLVIGLRKWMEDFDAASLMTSVTGKMQEFVAGIFGGPEIGGAVGEGLAGIDWGGVWSTVWEVMKATGSLVLEVDKLLLSLVWEGLKALGAGIWGFDKVLGQALWGVVTRAVPWLIEAVTGLGVAFMDAVLSLMAGIRGAMEDSMFSAFFLPITLGMKAFELIGGVVRDFWALINSIFGNSVNSVVGEDFELMWERTTTVFDGISATFWGLIDTVKLGLASLVDEFVGAWDMANRLGDAILNGVASGIGRAMAKLSAPVEFLKSVASKFGLTRIAVSTATDDNEEERQAGRRQILASGGTSEMEVLIGTLKGGFDLLHKDLLDMMKLQGSPSGRPRIAPPGTREAAVAGTGIS
jgi:hypothetical protein